MTRKLLLVLALVVAAALATSTGGVSSTSAERGMTGRIADDEDAYLGFEQTLSNTGGGQTDLAVTVANQFSPGTTLTTVEVTANGTTADLAAGDPLDPGESATATFTGVPCGASIRVVAVGGGVEVSLDRTVDC